MESSRTRWLDERFGLRAIYAAVLDRKVPRVNWAFTLGSATLFLAVTQAVTGILLTIYYVPHPNEAYESIQYIMTEVTFGWLIRGIHHWGATLMVITVCLHMVRTFYYGAYKYPREMTWITGVILLLATFGAGFTGYLLPWSNRSYWATTVGTALVETVPVVGPFLADVLRGGDTLSTLTLVRFFGAHIWVIPAVLFALIAVHLYLVVRLGISSVPANGE